MWLSRDYPERLSRKEVQRIKTLNRLFAWEIEVNRRRSDEELGRRYLVLKAQLDALFEKDADVDSLAVTQACLRAVKHVALERGIILD